MKLKHLLLICLWLVVPPLWAQTVFTDSADFRPVNPVDELVLADLNAQGIQPAPRCSDAVFLRRIFLDVLGRLPPPDRVRSFLADRNPDKRITLVDEVLADPGYADYWSMRYADILRVKAEFPINLWPNGAQAYHRWIHAALARNLPYDVFARELLCSSGSNFRIPQVNFYRAIQGGTPPEIARAVALTFLGMRTERWRKESQESLARVFSRLVFKPTAEWKEVIVCADPRPAEPMRVKMPDGREILIDGDSDPRRAFADWLTDGKNPWFAGTAVNRLWFWVMGRGLIDPADDIRKEARPVNPALLDFLAGEFKASKYDAKHILRLILTSRTYGASTVHADYARAEAHFAVYSLRQLEAEVILDALGDIFGQEKDRDRFKSMIPEPFTFIPAGHRTIQLADGSITSPFLEIFGRPPRDTGLLSERKNEPTRAQRLLFLNSSRIQMMINRSPAVEAFLEKYRQEKNPLPALLEEAYLRILSRLPTPDEIEVVKRTMREQRQAGEAAPADRLNRKDMLWALINTPEFLFRH